jgi:nucleotide-binding universal stress UspA family protein
MKIVLAVDGSRHSDWATDWMLELPYAHPRHVTALHVVDIAALRAPFMAQPAKVGYEGFIQAETKRLETLAKRVVQKTRKHLASHTAKTKVLVEKGPVAQTILKHIRGRGALVVLGERGLSNIERFFLGSVSTQVTLHATCSVLVVKARARPISRLLLALDGSKSSERAVQFLLKQMTPRRNRRIEVQILQVLPPFAYTQAAMTAMAFIHRYAQKLKAAGYLVKESIQAGDPGDEIIKAAKRTRADLLVVGAKGLSSVGRFLLGSVSSKLIRHSPCSILVVR